MRRWPQMGVRRKLLLMMQVTSGVAVLLACAVFMAYIWFNVRKVLARDLIVLADVIANNSTAALTFDDAAAGRETLQALRARPHILRADLYDRNGQLFASFVGPDGDPLASPPPPPPDGEQFGKDRLKVTRPVALQNRRIGTIYIESSLEPVREQLRVYGVAAIFVILMAISASLVLSSILQRTVSEPVLALMRTAQQIAQSGDYSLRAVSPSKDEIGQLTRIFNQMLDGIQQTEEKLQREIVERRRAEEEVRRHRDHLEELVRERTGALQLANDRLKQASEALTRSNAELEQFAYAASHDLREPLRTIINFVQLLQERLKSKLDATDERYMGFITDATKRMDTLIQDLLQYARLETRAQPFQPVNCNTVLQLVKENLRTTIEETRAEITHDHPLPIVRGDITQLTQLFQNLIGNGIKFRRPEEPPRLHIGATKQNEEWIFSVHDNGIGIDPQYFQRIFVIFERLHPQDKYPGTGIGLAICRKIVERHGGRIWVESEPGKGSTFFFTLPVSSAFSQSAG